MNKTIEEVYKIWSGDLSCRTEFSTTKYCYKGFKEELQGKGFTPEQILFYYDNFHDLKRIFQWVNHDLYIEYLRAETS